MVGVANSFAGEEIPRCVTFSCSRKATINSLKDLCFHRNVNSRKCMAPFPNVPTDKLHP